MWTEQCPAAPMFGLKTANSANNLTILHRTGLKMQTRVKTAITNSECIKVTIHHFFLLQFLAFLLYFWTLCFSVALRSPWKQGLVQSAEMCRLMWKKRKWDGCRKPWWKHRVGYFLLFVATEGRLWLQSTCRLTTCKVILKEQNSKKKPISHRLSHLKRNFMYWPLSLRHFFPNSVSNSSTAVSGCTHP